RVIGRKIGFTNRTIWAEYAVYAPIWGFLFDTTVSALAPPRQGAQHPFPLAQFAEPRIEPEIVFRLAAAPSPDMDEAALFGCIDWVAQGFEIVQSVFPGWKFAPADTVIANAMHGALLLAPAHAGRLRQRRRLGDQARGVQDRAAAGWRGRRSRPCRQRAR